MSPLTLATPCWVDTLLPLFRALLEESLAKWAKVVGEAKGGTCLRHAEAGAAGGVAFAAMAILAAEMRPVIAMMLELTGFVQCGSGRPWP